MTSSSQVSVGSTVPASCLNLDLQGTSDFKETLLPISLCVGLVPVISVPRGSDYLSVFLFHWHTTTLLVFACSSKAKKLGLHTKFSTSAQESLAVV